MCPRVPIAASSASIRSSNTWPSIFSQGLYQSLEDSPRVVPDDSPMNIFRTRTRTGVRIAGSSDSTPSSLMTSRRATNHQFEPAGCNVGVLQLVRFRPASNASAARTSRLRCDGDRAARAKP
jgi:hypothetical protein